MRSQGGSKNRGPCGDSTCFRARKKFSARARALRQRIMPLLLALLHLSRSQKHESSRFRSDCAGHEKTVSLFPNLKISMRIGWRLYSNRDILFLIPQLPGMGVPGACMAPSSMLAQAMGPCGAPRLSLQVGLGVVRVYTPNR